MTKLKKHNRLEHTLTENELRIEKTKLQLIKKLINENLNIALNKHLEDKLTPIDPKDSQYMFQQIKKIFKPHRSIHLDQITIPFKDEQLISNAGIDKETIEKDYNANMFLVKNSDEILNIMGTYLESIHSPKENDINNSNHRLVETGFNRFFAEKNLLETNKFTKTTFSHSKLANCLSEEETEEYLVTVEDLKYIFRNLRNKLSAGLDSIPNIILKNVPDLLISEYCILFNNMLNNLYFPPQWKIAKVVLIPKKDKDPKMISNLRPISLLPNISKIFEICVNSAIKKFCSKEKLTNEKQFGFKYNHSTIHAINSLVSDINWNLNKKHCTGVCCIDLEKAFDTIWIEGLIFKLTQLKFPLPLTILIYNMISNKQFLIVNGNATSKQKFNIINGLQQGTVNAPILFNIFLLELMDKVDKIISFADDILIYHADNKINRLNQELQSKFNIVETYTTNWQLKINVGKCETILFRPPVRKCNNNIRKNWKKFKINSTQRNTTIANNSCVKYLGIHLDKFLYFNENLKKQLAKAQKAFSAYKNLFHSKYLIPRVKVLMYQALIRPILTYGCPIWYNISPSQMEQIRVFERKCLRACTKLYRTPQSGYKKYISNKILYNTANVNRIDNFIIYLIRRHIARSSQFMENSLIYAPFYADDEYIKITLKNGFTPPEAFIYLDKTKRVQSDTAVPILYHSYRRANSKGMVLENFTENESRFEKSIPNKDLQLIKKGFTRNLWWRNM